MVHEDVLEACGKVDFRRLDRREAMEEVVGERAGAMLDGAGHAVLFARYATEISQGVEVDRDRSDGAVGRGMPPWLVPVCTLTLEMPRKSAATFSWKPSM